MSSKYNTVKAQVNKVLNEVKEQDPNNCYSTIKAISLFTIDTFTSSFRAQYAHLIPYAYKDASVNRYLELWLKANKPQ